MQPLRVSSYWTLMMKIFIPTAWMVFFGALTVFATVMNGMGHFHLALPIKALIIGLYILGILLLYLSFLRLKRVEMAPDHFFVTNYFKTYRYTYDSLKGINELDLLVAQVVVFRFVQKSAFGNSIYFVSRRKIWKEFVEQHPDLFAHLL